MQAVGARSGVSCLVQEPQSSPYKSPCKRHRVASALQASQRPFSPLAAGALFLDWNEEQVKRKTDQQQRDLTQPSPAKKPQSFFEWRESKKQAQQAGLSATAATSAAVLTSGHFPEAADAISQAPVPHTELQAPAGVEVTQEMVELRPADWTEPVPYLVDAADNADKAAQVLASTSNAAAPQPNQPQSLFASASEALNSNQALNSSGSVRESLGTSDPAPWSAIDPMATIAALGNSSANASVSGGHRSVMRPLEDAVSQVVGSATDQMTAAILRQLPRVEDVPGGEVLQELFADIQQLGSDLNTSMNASWSALPIPTGFTKVLAYLAASFGVLLLIRPKSPPQQQRKPAGPVRMVPLSSTPTTPAAGNNSNGGIGGFFASRTGNPDSSSPVASSSGKNGSATESSNDSSWGGGGGAGRGFAAALVGEWQQAGQQQQALQSDAEQSPRSTSSSPMLLGDGAASVAGGQQGGNGGMQAMERQRQHIKSLLQQTIQELGPLAAILPGGGEDTLKQELSALLQQLEQTAPNPGGLRGRPRWEGQGLGVAQWDSWERKTGTSDWDSRTPAGRPPPPDPQMLGSWQLECVSVPLEQASGPHLPPLPALSSMAFLAQLMDIIPGFGLDGITQQLWDVGDGGVGMASTCVLRLGPLGSLRVCARGGWRQMAADGRRASSQDLSAGSEDGVCSKAWFDTLSVQPLTLPFGIAPEEGMLPEVVVPVPSQFQEPSDWCTTYLDASHRISRGITGAYLFRKVATPNRIALAQAL